MLKKEVVEGKKAVCLIYCSEEQKKLLTWKKVAKQAQTKKIF
jgi:hypothetical protein